MHLTQRQTLYGRQALELSAGDVNDEGENANTFLDNVPDKLHSVMLPSAPCGIGEEMKRSCDGQGERARADKLARMRRCECWSRTNASSIVGAAECKEQQTGARVAPELAHK